MTPARLALDLPSARPPLAWLKADEVPTAFRACFRCSHGCGQGADRVCRHPELLDASGQPRRVIALRTFGGGCGPNAERMRDLSEA